MILGMNVRKKGLQVQPQKFKELKGSHGWSVKVKGKLVGDGTGSWAKVRSHGAPRGCQKTVSFPLKHVENYEKILEVNNMSWFTSSSSYYYPLNINCN